MAKAPRVTVDQPRSARTTAGGPRTRNPQRKGYGAGMFVRSYADNCPDPILSESPTLDGRDVTHAQTRPRGGADCNGTAGDPVLARRVVRATGNDDRETVFRSPNCRGATTLTPFDRFIDRYMTSLDAAARCRRLINRR